MAQQRKVQKKQFSREIERRGPASEDERHGDGRPRAQAQVRARQAQAQPPKDPPRSAQERQKAQERGEELRTRPAEKGGADALESMSAPGREAMKEELLGRISRRQQKLSHIKDSSKRAQRRAKGTETDLDDKWVGMDLEEIADEIANDPSVIVCEADEIIEEGLSDASKRGAQELEEAAHRGAEKEGERSYGVEM